MGCCQSTEDKKGDKRAVHPVQSPTADVKPQSGANVSESVSRPKRDHMNLNDPQNPKCAQRSPYAVDMKEGDTKYYCTCGYSKNQPFCDGSHIEANKKNGTNFQPKGYKATSTGTVYFCGCRRSANGVTCDGTHTKLSQCDNCPNKGAITDIEDIAPPKRGACSQKSPYLVDTEAGKDYHYCTCGKSKNQPFCDGTHVSVNAQRGTNFEPVKVAGSGNTIAFCGCRQSENGVTCDGSHLKLQAKIASRQPIVAHVEAEKTYYYCTCGYSKNQPFCDGSHVQINEQLGTNFQPTAYTADSTGDVAFCGCRRSGNGVLCDGSHLGLAEGEGGREIVATEFVEYKVIESRAYNHDTQVLRLKRDGTGEAMEPSYHFSVRINGSSRPYTPTTYDAASGEVELLVKRVDNGAVSPALTQLRQGDTLEMKGPVPGEYVWQKGTHSTLLLLAGGSGLTPVLQLMQRVVEDLGAEDVPSTEVHLVFSNKTVEDILLRETLVTMQEQYAKIVKNVVLCVTRADGDVAAPLVKGRMTQELLKGLVSNANMASTHAVVCGPPAFNKSAGELCAAVGLGSGQVTMC